MAATAFRLRVWTRYFTTPAAVWAYKTDPERIQAELRPWLSLRLADPDALRAALTAGQTALETTARLTPPGIAWPLQIQLVTPGACFEDRSENALFSRFEHRHTVEETPDGSRYIDDVVFQPRLPAAKLAAILTQRLFVHRHRVAAQHLPADARTVGTSILRVLIEEQEGFGAPAEG